MGDIGSKFVSCSDCNGAFEVKKSVGDSPLRCPR